MEIKIYPCKKNGTILKGFCLTICDLQGMYDTILQWKRFQKTFNINYYAVSIDNSEYKISKL